MAYSPSYNPTTSGLPTSKLGSTLIEKENIKKPTQVSSIPIEDEENIIPRPLKGEIKFNKPIYSQAGFRKKVNVTFDELTPVAEEINLNEFFNTYNKIFFNIPKEGDLSHTTLINTSKDFLGDFEDPKDTIIEGLQKQVEDLQLEIANLQAESLNESETFENIAEGQAEQLELGNPSDPNLNYDDLKTNLRKLFDLGELKNNTESKFEGGPKKDLRQAYESGGSSGVRKGQQVRLYSQWREDVDRRSSGKDQDDIFEMLDKTQQNIANGNGILL